MSVKMPKRLGTVRGLTFYWLQRWYGFAKPCCGSSFSDVDALNVGFIGVVWACRHKVEKAA